MARNSEKAQSMLYRFRETQAVEMGLGNRVKGERRPRMASSVSSLRDCERFRGDILKEISRKVSKIQDSSLTDYEIRDLNDEINGLMREKRHWETQIVNLGGANYKRGNQAMTDDDGREVPGTRGYKYFGRAKELPGVKEMFSRGAIQASEESARNASFQMFRNQGPEYYGDTDEGDAELIAEEEESARKEWEQAVRATTATLDLSDDISLPYPIASTSQAQPEPESEAEAEVEVEAAPKKGRGKSKRKAAPASAPDEESTSGKKAKTTEDNVVVNDQIGDEVVRQQAALAASFLQVLDIEALKMPTLPSKEEMGRLLLDVRKKALMEEYGV
ncbi:Isy1-like splicing factor [Naematelia encephala]|uniref:Isy1-like splicing factor n=1 Tax=Naematelia encephala TaxID=71784 RepID=A0A1Y2ASV2_9TREE|nr:Isy1-like splicing factor [Naematelia encephala]